MYKQTRYLLAICMIISCLISSQFTAKFFGFQTKMSVRLDKVEQKVNKNFNLSSSLKESIQKLQLFYLVWVYLKPGVIQMPCLLVTHRVKKDDRGMYNMKLTRKHGEGNNL